MEVIIGLDDYDDLFDDFDIRKYTQREISLDFMKELSRRLKNVGNDNIRLILTLPKKERDKKLEPRITKRLKEHFQKEYKRNKNRSKSILIKGLIFIALGVIFLFASMYAYNNINEFLGDYLFVGVYFFTWDGLEMFLYTYLKIKRKINFFKKLIDVDIIFKNEESYEGE